jgi:hypothetical protein
VCCASASASAAQSKTGVAAPEGAALSESRAGATVPLGTTMLSFRLFSISTSCELPTACFALAVWQKKSRNNTARSATLSTQFNFIKFSVVREIIFVNLNQIYDLIFSS